MPAEVPEEAPSHWLVYFTVDDVTAVAAAAVEAGGTVLRPTVAAGGPGLLRRSGRFRWVVFGIIAMTARLTTRGRSPRGEGVVPGTGTDTTPTPDNDQLGSFGMGHHRKCARGEAAPGRVDTVRFTHA